MSQTTISRRPIGHLLCVVAAIVCLVISGCGSSQTAAAFSGTDSIAGFSEAAGSISADVENWDRDEMHSLPNPGRTNPFQRFDVTANQSRIIPALKGFVERGTPSAVLAIGDRIAIIGVDESFEDVTVIEIKPPLVVYRQRGIEHRLSL